MSKTSKISGKVKEKVSEDNTPSKPEKVAEKIQVKPASSSKAAKRPVNDRE